jgi:hypothetical protein
MYWPQEDQSVKANFEKDIANVHLIYDYAAKNPETGENDVAIHTAAYLYIDLPLINVLQAPMKSGSMKCGSTMSIE